MYRTLCLIIKCILKLIFMHVCTYNALGTQMAPIRWNGPHKEADPDVARVLCEHWIHADLHIWRGISGRCDLVLSLCVWHHMRKEARRSSACRTLWEQREKKHCTPTHDKPPGLNTRRDPCSSSWGWTGGGEPRSRSPWTSSRWSSPYPRWPPATGARGTGKLSSPSVPDRWPSNRRTALDTTARTSTTAGWFSISGRPARISLFWGSSTQASGSPASRTSTLSVRMRLFFPSHRQTAKKVSLTFTLSYKHVIYKCF